MADTINITLNHDGAWQEMLDGPGFFTSNKSVEFIEHASTPDPSLIGHRQTLAINVTSGTKLWCRTKTPGTVIIFTGS